MDVVKMLSRQNNQKHKISSIWYLGKMKKMEKEYNARGERMYENPIKRENAKKNKKNKIKQDEKYRNAPE